MDKSTEEQRVHRAVKNHIMNTLGVNRDMIEEIVKEQVQKVLKQMFQESYLDKFLRGEVSRLLKNGDEYKWSNRPTDDFIKNTIREEVMKQISSRFDINVSVKDSVK